MSKKIVFSLLILVFCFTLSYAADETLSITTYYPSPYGSYRELRVQRMAIGDNYIQGGTYDWEVTDGDGGEIDRQADLVVEGNVGIGTTVPGLGLPWTGTPRQVLETYGRIIPGVSNRNGSFRSYASTDNNSDFGVYFYSKGADTPAGQPNKSHPAGRIYGDSFASGWENQGLVLEAADGWTSYISNQLVLKANGSIGIGTTSPNANAILELSSTTKAFMLPRMTTAEKNAISSPAAGMLVYDTTEGSLYAHNGSAWVKVGGGKTCVVTYNSSVGNCTCPASWTLKLDLGSWGYCRNTGCGSPECYAVYRPPNGACELSWTSSNIGEGCLCCQ